jgi:hypothetical protein
LNDDLVRAVRALMDRSGPLSLANWLWARWLHADPIVADVAFASLLRQVRVAGGWRMALACWPLVVDSARQLLAERAEFRHRWSIPPR